jgi:hypothetical protein
MSSSVLWAALIKCALDYRRCMVILVVAPPRYVAIPKDVIYHHPLYKRYNVRYAILRDIILAMKGEPLTS